MVETVPSAALLAEVEVSDNPPTVVLREKSTCCPCLGLPLVSSTLKITVDVSLPPTPPIPFSDMLWGLAETKDMELAETPLTVTGTVTLVPPTETVMVSLPTPPAAV